MTLHATRDGQAITIHGNTHVTLDVALGNGPGVPHIVMNDGYANHVRITEDATHVRYFWHQLGQLLEQADTERQAAAEKAEEPQADNDAIDLGDDPDGDNTAE